MSNIKVDRVFAKNDRKLLESAKSIFGENIVIDAWLIETYIDHTHPSYKDFLSVIEEKKADCNKDRIDVDGEDIALQFSSGNIVRFTSSEWGDISKNTDDFIEVELPTITKKKMADYIKGE